MTHLLKVFFKEISSNKHLQERLYHTKEISDVAVIANELGFKITAAEVLKAQESSFKISAIPLLIYQALNILSLNDQHVDLVAHGG